MSGMTGGTRWATCCSLGARTVPCGCGRRRRAPVCRCESIMTLRLSLSRSSTESHRTIHTTISTSRASCEAHVRVFRRTPREGLCCLFRLHQAMMSHGIQAPKRRRKKSCNMNAPRPPPSLLPLLPYPSLHTSDVGKIDAATAREMHEGVCRTRKEGVLRDVHHVGEGRGNGF